MEYVHAMFKKSYLESFYDLCKDIGGTTWDVMKEILEFEADRVVIGLTRNCFGNKDIKPGLDRSRLFPDFGTLLDWHSRIADCDDDEALKNVLGDEKAGLHHWRSIVSGGSGLADNGTEISMMETKFIEKAIELNKSSLARQFHFGVYYSWLKVCLLTVQLLRLYYVCFTTQTQKNKQLREQELSNLFWICACIEMKTRTRITEFSSIY